MGVVRYLTYQNRLGKLITAPGGKTVDAAIEDAEAALQSVSGDCLAEIDRLIRELGERGKDLMRPFDRDDVLYTGAREIAGMAAICQRPYLGEAAHSLCVLIDSSETPDRRRRDAIAVHISTLQLMRSMPDESDAAVQGQLVASLRDMVKRLSDDDARA